MVQTLCGNSITSLHFGIEKLVDERSNFIGRGSQNVREQNETNKYSKNIFFVIFRLDDIADLVLDHCVNNNIVKDDVRVLIKDAIMRKKHHQYQQGHKKDKNGEKSLIRSLTENSFTGSKSK